MEQLKLGQIVNVVGLKGELKVYPYTDYKERFQELQTLQIGNSLLEIEKVRYNGPLVILKIKGIDDRSSAEKLKGAYIMINKADARILPEDTYYIIDLIGLTVMDEQEKIIGNVTDVIQHPSQDLYEIQLNEGPKFLIPAVEEFILSIDLDKGIMRVHLIDGLATL
jgi:16S rRNA processing protein RimM